MVIKKVTEKQKETFNKASGHPLQAWEWGEFRKSAGNQVIRLAGYRDKKLTTAIQILIHGVPGIPIRIGTLIKGPKPTKEIIEELKKLAKEDNLVFIKLEPNYPTSVGDHNIAPKETKRVLNLLRESGAIPGRTLFTPTTFWIDLTRSEDELLRSFHSKTRYNIRLAQKKGVKIVEDNSKRAFEKYIKLTRETVERQGFYAHDERYHRLMWEHLHRTPNTEHRPPIARLLTARYKGEIITCWIVFVWKDTLYYPYGASSGKHKNVMASNLIMWEAIRYGKSLDLKTFDLWGREPGKGFTRFKEGYNPQVVKFLGTWDLITSPLYYTYRAAEFLRWSFLRLRTKLALTRPRF